MSGPDVRQLVEQALAGGAVTLSEVLAQVLPHVADADEAIRQVTDLVAPMARARQYDRPWVTVPGTVWEVEELHLR